MRLYILFVVLIAVSCKFQPKYEVGQCVTAKWITAEQETTCSHIWRINSVTPLTPYAYGAYPSIADQERGCPPVRVIDESDIIEQIECPGDFYGR